MKALVSFITSRAFLFTLLPLAIIAWLFATDPSDGQDTLLRVQLAAQGLLVIGLSYLVSKSLLGKASSEALYDAVIHGSVSAGVAYLGVCLLRALVLVGLLVFFAMLQR
jgi:hypothetical protein